MEYHVASAVIKHRRLNLEHLKSSAKKKNIKLIFSPTHDHRASGMVERLIQTLKRRLATMNIDPIWDNTANAEKISEKIESIRIIPNRVTKNPPFQAHFGRPKSPNYPISSQNLTLRTYPTTA